MSDVEYLRAALTRVRERARIESRAGAPASMVAAYVDLEVRHALAGHLIPESGVHCDRCSLDQYTDEPLPAITSPPSGVLYDGL